MYVESIPPSTNASAVPLDLPEGHLGQPPRHLEGSIRLGQVSWQIKGNSRYLVADQGYHSLVWFGQHWPVPSTTFVFHLLTVMHVQVTKLKKMYNLNSLLNRFEVMLAVANIFSFFQTMLEHAPKETRQRFSPHQVFRRSSSTIKFLKDPTLQAFVVHKSIPDCQKIWANPVTKLKTLKVRFCFTLPFLALAS